MRALAPASRRSAPARAPTRREAARALSILFSLQPPQQAMRSATRLLLGTMALLLVAGSARAQNDVTFQVDMNPYITTCQFIPASQGVNTPGDMNGWDTAQFPLADGDGDGIWSGTYSLPEGPINYKHYITNNTILSWENDPNRSYTVVAGAQTIAATAFNGPPPTDACSASNEDYDLIFAVDMSIALGRGDFRPAEGDRVGVTGEVPNGWDNANPVFLTEDSFTPGLYTGSVTRSVLNPSATGFKFVTQNADGTIDSWDSVNPAITPDNTGGGDPNRIIRITGNETDDDGNGNPDFFYDNDGDPSTPVYFQDANGGSFLTGPATVTYNVDMRSALFRIAAEGSLPQSGGAPGGETSITGLFINGPAAGESDEDGGPGVGIGDWADWGPVLAAQTNRALSDPDGDNIWSITLNYSPGAYETLVAKFGANGQDNEAGFGGDHQLPITEGANTYNLVFGCVRLDGGIYTDETGGTPPTFTGYDEYIIIRNDLTPATCTAVASGGVAGDVMAVGITDGPSIAGLVIGAAYPNPVAGRATLDLTLDRAMGVTVRLFDVTGRQVASLVEGNLTAGRTPVSVDASGLSAGIYVLRVEAAGQVVSRRVTVVR